MSDGRGLPLYPTTIFTNSNLSDASVNAGVIQTEAIIKDEGKIEWVLAAKLGFALLFLMSYSLCLPTGLLLIDNSLIHQIGFEYDWHPKSLEKLEWAYEYAFLAVLILGLLACPTSALTTVSFKTLLWSVTVCSIVVLLLACEFEEHKRAVALAKQIEAEGGCLWLKAAPLVDGAWYQRGFLCASLMFSTIGMMVGLPGLWRSVRNQLSSTAGA